ncbi:sialate O-acetylesterase [Paenibacillus sp. GYB003]|uniref:sialate O-acetylesterase n=1 Tax=Paenibacillus sp. GYB003 TaxID=2994392 RepID=UPI002F964DEB
MNRIKVEGPEPHRVYQRNDRDEADIPFAIELSAPVQSAAVQTRLTSETFASPWSVQGEMNGTTFEGVLKRVPVGRHNVEIRVLEPGGIATASASVSVGPVFVGDLWILAGQSNMEGCGKLVDTEQPQEGVSCFYLGDKWDLAVEPLCWLQEAIDPVHWRVPEEQLEEERRAQRRERVKGAGLGLTFGKELLRHTGVPIGLLMCAHGGTSMSAWDPGLLHEGGRSLYGAMLRKVKKLGGKVKGCLWYQGESDANEQAVPHYAERFKNWVACLRRDVGDPELPFIYAQLSVHYSNMNAVWWNAIQHDQLMLEAQVPHAAMVPTIDAILSDAIHLDAVSLQSVGRRMAWRALSLAYPGHAPVAEPGPRPSAFAWNEDRTELAIEVSGANERLADVAHAFGFQVDADGVKQPFTATIADDGKTIRLRFERPVPEGDAFISHGAGFNPAVNVKDMKQIPLPVFGPIAI